LCSYIHTAAVRVVLRFCHNCRARVQLVQLRTDGGNHFIDCRLHDGCTNARKLTVDIPAQISVGAAVCNHGCRDGGSACGNPHMIQAQIVCVGITGASGGRRIDGRRAGYDNRVNVAGIDIPPQHDCINARQRAVSIAECKR